MEDLFRQFWWLIFPIFFGLMGVLNTLSSERRARAALDVIKSYVDQGKDPPAELLKLASKDDPDTAWGGKRGNTEPAHARAWTFITFAALAIGFGAAYWFADLGANFLIVAIVMSVVAIGSLFILIFGRK